MCPAVWVSYGLMDECWMDRYLDGRQIVDTTVVYIFIFTGIYEWQARHDDAGQNYVVYVGNARRKKIALESRILEYCRTGDHKSKEINRALKLGYELWVRVKPVKKSLAEKEENMMLAKYNYAWNKRKNRPYRPNIPPAQQTEGN